MKIMNKISVLFVSLAIVLVTGLGHMLHTLFTGQNNALADSGGFESAAEELYPDDGHATGNEEGGAQTGDKSGDPQTFEKKKGKETNKFDKKPSKKNMIKVEQ